MKIYLVFNLLNNIKCLGVLLLSTEILIEGFPFMFDAPFTIVNNVLLFALLRHFANKLNNWLSKKMAATDVCKQVQFVEYWSCPL